MTAPPADRLASRAALAWMVCIVALYAGLIGNGQWQGDEYLAFAFQRMFGFAEFRHRLAVWSPRPVSETLIALYALCVDRFRAPLIVGFLAVLWSSCIAVVLAAVASAGGGRARHLLMPATVIAMALLLNRPGELFFWPVGAAAYLTTCCGITALVLWQVADGRVCTRRQEWAHLLGLVALSWCSELGALFVVLFGAVIGVRAAWRRTGRVYWWAIPTVLALALILWVRFSRASGSLLLVPGSVYAGHWLRSARAAAADFSGELVGFGDEAGKPALTIVAAASKLLLFAGFLCVCPGACPGGRSRERVLLLAGLVAALLAAAWLSALLAYENFGMLCCQRHASFREWMIVLALLVGGSLCGLRLGRPRPRLAAACLALAAGLCLAVRAGALRHDYALRRAEAHARSASWRSGLDPQSTAMVFELPPATRLSDDVPLAPGLYRAKDPIAWPYLGILLFFGKQSLEVRAPAP